LAGAKANLYSAKEAKRRKQMGKIGKDSKILIKQRTIAKQDAQRRAKKPAIPFGSGDAVVLPLRTLTVQLEQAFGASLTTVPGEPIRGLNEFNAAIQILAAKVEAEDSDKESN
jgi:hypothetical protein